MVMAIVFRAYYTFQACPWGGRGVAAPYKAARPCSDLVAPPPLLENLSPHPDSRIPENPTRTEVRREADGRPAGVERRDGCPPLLKTFLLEASPLEAGSSIPPVADRCCTVVVFVVVVAVVAIVLCCSRLYHRCTGCCHRGTSAGA